MSRRKIRRIHSQAQKKIGDFALIPKDHIQYRWNKDVIDPITEGREKVVRSKATQLDVTEPNDLLYLLDRLKHRNFTPFPDQTMDAVLAKADEDELVGTAYGCPLIKGIPCVFQATPFGTRCYIDDYYMNPENTPIQEEIEEKAEFTRSLLEDLREGKEGVLRVHGRISRIDEGGETSFLMYYMNYSGENAKFRNLFNPFEEATMDEFEWPAVMQLERGADSYAEFQEVTDRQVAMMNKKHPHIKPDQWEGMLWQLTRGTKSMFFKTLCIRPLSGPQATTSADA